MSDARGDRISKRSRHTDWRISHACAAHLRNTMPTTSRTFPTRRFSDAGGHPRPCRARRRAHSEVARNLQAKAVIEAANAPTDPEADKILNERGIRSSRTSSQMRRCDRQLF